MFIFILLIIVVLLFTATIGVILMKRDSKNAVTSEKMTDDVDVLYKENDNMIDDEII